MWNMVASSAADRSAGSAKKLRENTSNARCRAASGKLMSRRKRVGVEVVEPLVDVGHRHRGQRRGRTGVEPDQVAQPKRRAAQCECERVQRRRLRQAAERVAPALPVDQRVVLDGGEHAPARSRCGATGPAGCSTAGRTRGSRGSSAGRCRRRTVRSSRRRARRDRAPVRRRRR